MQGGRAAAAAQGFTAEGDNLCGYEGGRAAAVTPTTGATCNADGSGGACDDDDHDDELSDDDDTSMVIETDGRQRKRPRRH